MSVVLSFTNMRSILEIRGPILTGWTCRVSKKNNNKMKGFFPTTFPTLPRAHGALWTDGTDESASSLCDVGREHGTSNCSAAAQWAVALTAVHIDAIESDAEVRQLNFCYHTALKIIFCLFVCLFRNPLLSIYH